MLTKDERDAQIELCYVELEHQRTRERLMLQFEGWLEAADYYNW